jgi:hypothetical protein
MSSASRTHCMGMLFLFSAALFIFMCSKAHAGEGIGVASLVRNQVNGVLPSGTLEIQVGQSVVRDEIIKTSSDSQAKLVFTDSTNLAVGPNSVVKLDKFVAAESSSYSKATVNALKGAFRFTTGHSEKPAYEVNTGIATIGVRGTIYELFVEPSQTTVNVLEGRVRACVREDKYKPGKSRKPRCCDVGPLPNKKSDEAEAQTAPRPSLAGGKKAVLTAEGCALEDSSGPEMDCSTAGFCDAEQYAEGLPVELPLLLPLVPPIICAAAGCFDHHTRPTPTPIFPTSP